MNKRDVFVRVRDDVGARFPACVVRAALLHELAHVVHREGVGHDAAFWRWEATLLRDVSARGADVCDLDAVRPDYLPPECGAPATR